MQPRAVTVDRNHWFPGLYTWHGLGDPSFPCAPAASGSEILFPAPRSRPLLAPSRDSTLHPPKNAPPKKKKRKEKEEEEPPSPLPSLFKETLSSRGRRARVHRSSGGLPRGARASPFAPNKGRTAPAGLRGGGPPGKKAITITYNSRDSLLVTHATTGRPIHGLNIGERTGTVIFHDLWS